LSYYSDNHFILANDIFSFKKEFIINGAQDNYVTVIYRIHDCTPQKALEITLKVLADCEEKFIECVSAIKSSDLKFLEDRLTALENLMFECIRFYRSKNNIRYHSKDID
jgi:hypothetical protein